MVNFGYPYNDIVICKDSTDYLDQVICKDSHTHHIKSGSKSNTNSQLQSQFSQRI